MLTSHTRSLLLEAGRQSIDLWLRARHTEPGLKSNARVAYDRLAEEAPWPDQQANRVILVFIVLPMAAFYTALRERGRTEQEAVERVTRAALPGAGLERQVTGLLLRTAPGRRLFMRFVPHLARLLMPPPAWELTWVERSRERVAVDVTRCYAVDTLRRLDAALVAVAVCADDDYVFAGLCPRLRFPAPARSRRELRAATSAGSLSSRNGRQQRPVRV